MLRPVHCLEARALFLSPSHWLRICSPWTGDCQLLGFLYSTTPVHYLDSPIPRTPLLGQVSSSSLTSWCWLLAWTWTCPCFTLHISGPVHFESLPLSSFDCTAMPCSWLPELGMPQSKNESSDLDQYRNIQIPLLRLLCPSGEDAFLKECEQTGILTWYQVRKNRTE